MHRKDNIVREDLFSAAWRKVHRGCGVIARALFPGVAQCVHASPVLLSSNSNLPFPARSSTVGPRVEGTLLCASGLDGLARILDAHRRRPEPEITTLPCLSQDTECVSVRGNDADEFPELTGVWFSQGRVHGKVDLSGAPRRGWFEMYATEAA
jgi:hypothetical protein